MRMFTNFVRDGFDTHDLFQLFYFFKDLMFKPYASWSCSSSDCIDEEIMAGVIRTIPSVMVAKHVNQKRKEKKSIVQ